MSNSTKNLIATIMANSAEENMAKLILDIKKKKTEIGISNSDVRNGKVTEIDAALTKSEIYKKIRSALKNKKPTFYFIEKAGDKTVIFLKKGDKEMKRYEIEGDFAVPANITSAVSTLKTSDIETYQAYIISICFDLNRLIGTQTIQIPAPAGVPAGATVPFTGTQFMNDYIEVLVDFIDECPAINLDSYIDNKFPNQSPQDLFYLSLRGNIEINKIITILEKITNDARDLNCIQAGGSKKQRGGAKIDKRKFMIAIKNAMTKGLPKKTLQVSMNSSMEEVKQIFKKIGPLQLNIITPLAQEEHKTIQGRYQSFKKYLDQYITNIIANAPDSINNSPIGHVHYIDFDLQDDKLSSNIERNVRVSLNAVVGPRARIGLNNDLKQFILKSKKSLSGKSNNVEFKQFVMRYIQDLKDLIKKGSKVARQEYFQTLTFANENTMHTATGLATFSSTEYRLYQYYNYLYQIFDGFLYTYTNEIPFQLPSSSNALDRVCMFMLLKVRNNPKQVGTSPNNNVPNVNGERNTVFTNDLVLKYINRYYRIKERSRLEGAKSPATILEIEDSEDSFYHSVFASVYSRSGNLQNFLTNIGENPENLAGAQGLTRVPGVTAANLQLGPSAVNPVVGPDVPDDASRRGLTNFSSLRNNLIALRLNGANDVVVAVGEGNGHLDTRNQPPSVRWMIANNASPFNPTGAAANSFGGVGNKTFEVVSNILKASVEKCKSGLLASDVSKQADQAFKEYREWFVTQLRKIIATRITTTTIFDDYLKKMIQQIRDHLKKSVKENANVKNAIQKDASISKYKDTFLSKLFRTLNQFPENDVLEDQAQFNPIKTRVSDEIKRGTKACEFEFLVLNTLIQSNICNTGFYDIQKNYTNSKDSNSFILMGNGIYKQLKHIQVPTLLSTCILIQSDENYHYNAVVRRHLTGTTLEMCKMMQGFAPETIISYYNLIVGEAGFEKAKETGGNHTVLHIQEFYTRMIALDVNNINPADIGGAINTALQIPSLQVAKKKRGECVPFEQFLYDPSADMGVNGVNIRPVAITGMIMNVTITHGTFNDNTGITNPGVGVPAVVANLQPLTRFDVNA